MHRYFFNVELSQGYGDETGEDIANDREAIQKAAQLLAELAADEDLMIEAGGAISVLVRRAEGHLITLTATRDPSMRSANVKYP